MKKALERFLHERVYTHERVLRMTADGKNILRSLFAEYVTRPQLLPEKHLRRWTGAGAIIGPPPPDWITAARKPVDCLERVVGDYLAGMTDRYAQLEYRRLFLPSAEP
jgi:dGTPase